MIPLLLAASLSLGLAALSQDSYDGDANVPLPRSLYSSDDQIVLTQWGPPDFGSLLMDTDLETFPHITRDDVGTRFLLGAGGLLSQGLGESDAAFQTVARLQTSGWKVEADWSGADKVTPTASGGWLGGVAVDRQGSHLIVGLAYRHRVGEAEPGQKAWKKETVWLRAGWRIVTDEGIEARLLADSALTSRDRQSSLRGTFTLPLADHLSLEPEVRVLLYDQGAYQANRRIGYTVSLNIFFSL